MSPLIPYLIAFLGGIVVRFLFPFDASFLFWLVLTMLVLSVVFLLVVRKRSILLDYRPYRVVALLVLFLFSCVYADIRYDMIKNCEQPECSPRAERVQQWCREALATEGIQPSNMALLSAVMLGDKTLLSEEQKTAFRDTGTVHILVVSGMHVALVYLMIIRLFAIFRLDRNPVVRLVVVAIVWLYAAMTGLAPAVCRASLMLSFMVVIPIINARIEHQDAVYLSLVCLLLYDPTLISSYSLWLSYCAVYALVQTSWVLWEVEWFIRNKVVNWVAQLALVSIVCQLATSPIILSFNDHFPTFFVVNNIMIVPLLSPLLFLSMGVIALPHSLAQYLARVVDFLLSLMDGYAHYAQSWHSASVSLPGYTDGEIVAMAISMTLFFTVVGHWQTRYRSLCGWVFGLSCVVSAGITIYNDQNSLNTKDCVIVWRRYDKNNVSFFSDGRLLHCLKDTTETYSLRECERLRKEYRAVENRVVSIGGGLSVVCGRDTVRVNSDGVVYCRDEVVDIQILGERQVVLEL